MNTGNEVETVLGYFDQNIHDNNMNIQNSFSDESTIARREPLVPASKLRSGRSQLNQVKEYEVSKADTDQWWLDGI